MKRFYEAVVKYDRIGESGSIEKATEQYLIDAVSITYAEACLIKDLEPFIQGECDVTSIKLAKYAEFIPENKAISMVDGEARHILKPSSNASKEADKYFAVKTSFITLDENKGKEKKTPYHYIVHATSVDAANDTVEYFMKDALSDYQINNIVETKIIDVILIPE